MRSISKRDNNSSLDDLHKAGVHLIVKEPTREDMIKDMRAFDKLGPHTRKVLNYDMIVTYSAYHTFEQMARRMPDKQCAQYLLQANERIRELVKVS